jgi:hypothetical protein
MAGRLHHLPALQMKNEVRLDIQVTPYVAAKINKIIADLLKGEPPVQSDIQYLSIPSSNSLDG